MNNFNKTLDKTTVLNSSDMKELSDNQLKNVSGGVTEGDCWITYLCCTNPNCLNHPLRDGKRVDGRLDAKYSVECEECYQSGESPMVAGSLCVRGWSKNGEYIENEIFPER